MATEQKGVIYYKLDPDYHYKGDYTKNCGLNGTEIDSNFHFLRGYDIASFDVSENKEELVITRLNGEKLIVNVRESFNGYEFAYDKAKGVLVITTPYGETFDMEGFLTEKSLKVHGDATIEGEGTRFSPMSVSSNARTGTFKPVKTLVNIVEGEKLPTENITKGDRYVTKEPINTFGLLYPLEGVMKIQKRLEEIGSEWRVPTKADWDQLLNISEDRAVDKNHDDKRALTNVYYGKNAGAYLKANKFWEPIYRKLEDGEIVLNDELRYTLDDMGNYVQDYQGEYIKVINSEDKYGFSVYPVGFGGRRGKTSIGGFREWAAYWTSSEEDGHQDMFVKVFSHEERGVEQNTWGRDCYLSLRLVKDYNGRNLSEVELIDGNTVGTVYIETLDETDCVKYDTSLVWTNANISFTNPEYSGVTSYEWKDVVKDEYRYYVNDWNGEQWIKNELREGESVVIFNVEDIEMHEWRLVNGELIDTLDILKREIHDEISDIKDEVKGFTLALDREIEERKAADVELETLIKAEIQAREDAIDAVKLVIEEEKEIRSTADKHLSQEIETEVAQREEADRVINERLDEIVTDINNKFNEVNTRVDEFVEDVNENIVRLDDRIDEVIEDVNETNAILTQEIIDRKVADAELKQNIDKNKVVLADDKSGLVLVDGYVDNEGEVVNTTVKVKVLEIGMIKIDAEGLYFDGNFNFGDDWKIDNE